MVTQADHECFFKAIERCDCNNMAGKLKRLEGVKGKGAMKTEKTVNTKGFMIKRFYPNFCNWGGLLLVACCLLSCGKAVQDEDYLIRVGNSTISVLEFKHAVDAASEEIFVGEQEIGPVALRDLQMRILNQLTEELIIAERGKSLGIEVDDKTLDDAVAQIKADYPDDTFEKTLLENAVSFQAWKKKLAMRLLTNKVIKSELIDKVQITSEDVDDYFQVHYPKGVPEGQNVDEINKKIIRHLRHKKAEAMYPDWMEKLRKSYPVDIDQQRWNNLIGAKK